MYQRPFRPKRQKTQYTCMATSLSMCLEANGIDADEDTTNKVMGAAPMKGARWEEMIAAAQHFGCRATLISPATLSDLKRYTENGSPCVISWNPEGRDWSHASVVYEVSDDLTQVTIADPNMPDPHETIRILSAHEFYKSWYEKWSNYLVRRVCVAIEREITEDGFQRFANQHQSNAYTSHKETKENHMKISIEEFQTLLSDKGIEKEAASGLYGYTKRTEKDVSVAISKIQRVASKIARSSFKRDTRIAGFMALHAKRTKSGAANILVSAYQNLAPKMAKEAKLNRKQIKILEQYDKNNLAFAFEDLDGFTQGELGRHCDELAKDVSKWLSDRNFKTALMAAHMHRTAALYGRNPKVVKMGLQAIMDLQTQVGEIANSLHKRRAAKWNKITGYLKAHLKATKCAYSSCLFNAYPEMPKVATEHTAKYPKGPMSGADKKKWEKEHPELAENAADESNHFADEMMDTDDEFDTLMAELLADSVLPNDDESDAMQPDMDDMGYEPGETKRAAKTTTLANGDSIEWIED